MILVDSSIWIQCLRQHDVHAQKMNRYLRTVAKDIVTTGIILMEVVQGIKDETSHARVSEELTSLPVLPIRNPETYLRASSIYRLCRKNGITIASTIDTILAAVAMENDAEILSLDEDFHMIAKIIDLKLHPLP